MSQLFRLFLRMRWFRSVYRRSQTLLNRSRQVLGVHQRLPAMVLMGLLAGLATGLLALLFRFIVDAGAGLLLNGQPENFEQLDEHWRLLLPIAGALVIWLLFFWQPAAQRRVGVGHVIDRFENHQGRLPFANACNQFIGGTLALISGQSCGREGPAIHIGAYLSSSLGQKMRLPYNNIRTLVGCGVAAAIAASFNTPLAGVILAMEVVVREYTLEGFTPLLVAAAVGALLTQSVHGPQPAFDVPAIAMQSLLEVPYIAFMGILIGATAAFFIYLQCRLAETAPPSLLTRLLAIGTLTAIIGSLLPGVMGVGYDTLGQAMLGQLAIPLLFSLALAKLLTAAVTNAWGVPGGTIGPCLVIGACLGGALGLMGASAYPTIPINTGLYVLLGMAAMMAATLHAPLAATMTVVELTHNPSITLPTLLSVLTAYMACRSLFRQPSLFHALLAQQGFTTQVSPQQQFARRIAAAKLMDRRIRSTHPVVHRESVVRWIEHNDQWLWLHHKQHQQIYRLADLLAYMDQHQIDVLDLRSKQAPSISAVPLSQQATIAEAQQLMKLSNAQIIYLQRPPAPLRSPVAGIIRRQQLEQFFQDLPPQGN